MQRRIGQQDVSSRDTGKIVVRAGCGIRHRPSVSYPDTPRERGHAYVVVAVDDRLGSRVAATAASDRCRNVGGIGVARTRVVHQHLGNLTAGQHRCCRGVCPATPGNGHYRIGSIGVATAAVGHKYRHRAFFESHNAGNGICTRAATPGKGYGWGYGIASSGLRNGDGGDCTP